MSLHDVRRRDPVWVSGGSVWPDGSSTAAPPPSSPSSSPRCPQDRDLSVAYMVVEDAAPQPHSEDNVSLRCLAEACADVRAVLKVVSFERISLGATDVLDSFYNAGEWRHARSPAGQAARQAC